MSGTDHAQKKAVRDRMTVTGESYTTALRAFERMPSPSVATATFIDGRRLRIVVGEPPTERAIIRGTSWPHSPANLDPVTTARRLDGLLIAHGWHRAPGAEWPSLPALQMRVEVELTDDGLRDDAVENIWRDHSLTGSNSYLPYLYAVADACEREGIIVTEASPGDIEPRQGYLELAFAFNGDDPLSVCWRENMGWYYVRHPERSESALGNAYDLPVGFLAEPHQVARAIRDAIRAPVMNADPIWAPPKGYDPNAISGYDDPEDVDPLPFERWLCSYVTHPSWRQEAQAE